MIKKIESEGDFVAFLKDDLKTLMAVGYHKKWHKIEDEIQASVNSAFSPSFDSEKTRGVLEQVPAIIEKHMPYGIFSPFYALAAQNVLQVLIASSEKPQSTKLVSQILSEAEPAKKGIELVGDVLIIDGVSKGAHKMPGKKEIDSIRELSRPHEEQIDKLRA